MSQSRPRTVRQRCALALAPVAAAGAFTLHTVADAADGGPRDLVGSGVAMAVVPPRVPTTSSTTDRAGAADPVEATAADDPTPYRTPSTVPPATSTTSTTTMSTTSTTTTSTSTTTTSTSTTTTSTTTVLPTSTTTVLPTSTTTVLPTSTTTAPSSTTPLGGLGSLVPPITLPVPVVLP